ncbi:hypothetical protein ElyMa_003772200 [Elysia marginata]|uniref:Uncharacterized protein n=1 Tax=Elysia marginata TaxID=1093978 RepID=A0AAV4F9F9_9GAST|nr:hypothetical protein ElyMa_003772200 [Elysia marginata]
MLRQASASWCSIKLASSVRATNISAKISRELPRQSEGGMMREMLCSRRPSEPVQAAILSDANFAKYLETGFLVGQGQLKPGCNGWKFGTGFDLTPANGPGGALRQRARLRSDHSGPLPAFVYNIHSSHARETHDFRFNAWRC